MGNVRSGRVVDSALRRRFICNKSGKHLQYYLFDSDCDDPIAQTMISHGAMGDTISSKILALMARELHLSKSQFLNLIDCSLDEGGYRKVLQIQDDYEE